MQYGSNMRRYRLVYALGAALVAPLVGCGGSQVSVSDAAPVLPRLKSVGATSGALVYVSEQTSDPNGQVFVFSYPRLKLLHRIGGLAAVPGYLCSDESGDVFVTATNFSGLGYVYEFAHGGTRAVATLVDPGDAQSCSVDPTSGNLAVANGANVAVYAPGQTVPIIYQASDIGAADCAYDDSGNLFVDDFHNKYGIAELRAGGSSFSDISLNKVIETYHLQWWKNQLIVYTDTASNSPFEIVPIQVSGSSGTVGAPIQLDSKTKHRGEAWEFALWAKTIVFAEGFSPSYFWHYPEGGEPYKALPKPKHETAYYGIAISK